MTVWVTYRPKQNLDTVEITSLVATGASTLSEARGARKAFGQLVALGFDVAVFTPAPYQRRRLRRPSKELSSRGGLRA